MKIIRIGLKICVWGGIIMIIALTLILSASYILGPPPIDIGATTVFYDQEGNELHPQEKQQTFELDDLPSYLVDATIVTEVRHFYSYLGFDFRGIVLAVATIINSFLLN